MDSQMHSPNKEIASPTKENFDFREDYIYLRWELLKMDMSSITLTGEELMKPRQGKQV